VIAIDTDLLVYAHRRGTTEHRRAQRAIQKAAEDPRGWGIALQSVAEFYSVVTHPAAAGGPATAARAMAFLQSLGTTPE
jgi:predicted nucleic acid-binding protein